MSAPYPPDAPTQRLGGNPPPRSAAAPLPTTPERQHVPGLRRRLAFLAATLYTPLILLGYALYLYGPTTCVAGPLCSFDTAPGWAQVLLIALGFGLLYFIGVRPLAALLDERQTPSTAMTRTLRQATRYETMRPLLAIFGAMIALVLLGGLVARTLTLPAFIIGGGIAALLLWLAATGEP